MAVPTTSTNMYGGIFQYLVQIDGDPAQVKQAQAKLSQLTPETAAVYAALNMLPEGDLKGWLMANPIQFWKKVYELFFGKEWTSGDYVLGERLSDQVYCNADIGRSQVSNDMVDLAHVIFNQLFGVRIGSSDDLDALDNGVAAYRARASSEGISDSAIERAVYLKQHFYPISTYNKVCWDLKYFEYYPLVGRIPDHEIGKWYTGTVLGGAYAIDGVIPVSATDILDQYIDAEFDSDTGNITTADGTVIAPDDGTETFLDKVITFVQTDPLKAAAIAAAVIYAVYELENDF